MKQFTVPPSPSSFLYDNTDGLVYVCLQQTSIEIQTIDTLQNVAVTVGCTHVCICLKALLIRHIAALVFVL